MADREHPAKRPRHFPEREYPEQRLTGKIIASSYTVFRSFGFGFWNPSIGGLWQSSYDISESWLPKRCHMSCFIAVCRLGSIGPTSLSNPA